MSTVGPLENAESVRQLQGEWYVSAGMAYKKLTTSINLEFFAAVTALDQIVTTLKTEGAEAVDWFPDIAKPTTWYLTARRPFTPAEKTRYDAMMAEKQTTLDAERIALLQSLRDEILRLEAELIATGKIKKPR